MKRFISNFAWSLGAAIIFAASSRIYAQGPLAPPAGAPAPVFKTLTQVEPRIPVQTLTGISTECQFLITKPGSYYLTANIKGVSGLSCIKMTTTGVTLDLNGFSLLGVPNSMYGVLSNNGESIIRNGSIRDWGAIGVYAGFGTLIEDLLVSGCQTTGISLQLNCIVRHCVLYQNKFGGISANDGCILENCQVLNNTQSGIAVGGVAGIIRNCAIRFNSNQGISQSNGGSWLIEGNTIYGNSNGGIDAAGGNIIKDNVIGNNGASAAGIGPGIYLRLGTNHVEGNHLTGNKYGIYAANIVGKEVVIRNTVEASTVSNYNGNGGLNGQTFAPIITTYAGATNPFANLSSP